MKRFFCLTAAAAALLLAGCSKSIVPAGGDRVIAFQTANYATKLGIPGPLFPTDETFGVFSWTDGTDGTYFMDNEVVSYREEEELWLTAVDYKWPSDKTVDFFCFYPAKMKEISVDKAKVDYKAYDVEANPDTDVLYADKDVAFADYPEKVPGSVSAYTAVPVLFHHALSKLSIKVALAYNHKEEADGTVTDWSATLNSISLAGVYKKGDCELNLAAEPEIGLVGWTKPEGNVWTNDGSTMEKKNLAAAAAALVPGEPVEAVPEMFVLPQKLAAGQQKVVLNLTIKTKRNGADFLSETFDISADLGVPQVLEAWQMNHSISYLLSVNPTASNGNGGNPVDPSKPVDPNNPDLSDVTIRFAPAVGGWEAVDVSATIKL